MSTDLIVKNYSDKSIAVYGDTKAHKDFLKEKGGKFNSSLKDGPGWIFPKSQEEIVRKYVKKHGGESLENKITHKELKNAALKKIKFHLSEIEKVLETLEDDVSEKKNGVSKKSKFVPKAGDSDQSDNSDQEENDQEESEHSDENDEEEDEPKKNTKPTKNAKKGSRKESDQDEEEDDEHEKPAPLPKRKK